MAQGEFPSFYRYIGPAPSGGHYYDDPSTGQILDLPAAPTPEQQQAYEATKPGIGTIAQTQAVDRGDTQTLGGPVASTVPVSTADQADRGQSADSAVRAPTQGGVGCRQKSQPQCQCQC